MSGTVLLVGVLAHPDMLQVLGLDGRSEVLPGRLAGGARAGIDKDGWPRLEGGGGTVPAVRVTPNPALERYSAVMDLKPRHGILGLGDGKTEGEAQPALAAGIARHILTAPPDQPAAEFAKRLTMIGVIAASELRGSESPYSGSPLVDRRAPEDVQILEQHEAYGGFFSVQVCKLRHRTHAGGMTPDLPREALVSGDAVVVLPWDPVRDRVLLIEQFRMAPVFRRDPQPWLLEAVAGRVDAGETVEQAALREAREEANLPLTRLFPAIHHYPSPGVLGEYLYLYVGIADLPDGIEGVHGLETEAEDIRGHVIGRSDLARMAMSGQVANGPLAMLSLWLELRKDTIRAALGQV